MSNKESADGFFRRQITWGLQAKGADLTPELRWFLSSDSLEPGAPLPDGLLEQAVASLDAAYESGPEGFRSGDRLAAWEEHIPTMLRKGGNSGVRTVVLRWLKKRSPGSVPEEQPVRSILGFGTDLFGMADLKPDGSYVATKFVVLAGIPILPRATYRVKEAAFVQLVGPLPPQRGYEVIERRSLWRPQVVRCYLFTVGALAFLTVAILAGAVMPSLREGYPFLFALILLWCVSRSFRWWKRRALKSARPTVGQGT